MALDPTRSHGQETGDRHPRRPPGRTGEPHLDKGRARQHPAFRGGPGTCIVYHSRVKPVMHAIAARPELQLQVLAAGTMVLERFGLPVNHVKADGFDADGEVYIELEGSTPATMAKSVGIAVMEFASEFQRLKPDLVLLIGDRYEALAPAIAAAYMNICL